MNFLNPIIGESVAEIGRSRWGCRAVLTDRGFIVCDPHVIYTGWSLHDADPSERCEFRRGHIHLRIHGRASPGGLAAFWNLHLVSGWIVILPFQDLPPESRRIIEEALPEGLPVSTPSVKPLQEVPEAYRSDARRVLRLRDALADAGFPSPLTLTPTGLHSAPLRIYSRNALHPLSLPTDHKLAALLKNWSGGDEVVEFERKRPDSDN